jgi:hypothetical protein
MNRIQLLACALLTVSCSHGSSQSAPPAPPPAATATATVATANAPPLFEPVRQVLQSPRCVNCHPAGDVPLQGDRGALHAQNVQRGPEGRGLAGQECTTCHGAKNPPDSYGAHQPPGVSTGWRLPPPEHKMVFQGLSGRELCEQLKDPQRNGGKDLAALVHHAADDPLVAWGWTPGFGRAPVEMPRAEFVAYFREWAEKGAPCP